MPGTNQTNSHTHAHRPRRFLLACAILLGSLPWLASRAVDSDPADVSEIESLRRAVLRDPFDLERLERLRAARVAADQARITGLNALARGLAAVLKDDHETAAKELAIAKRIPTARELARRELGDRLWASFVGDADTTGPQLRDYQSLCPACGHTRLMDCRNCRGDGFDRGETCSRCEGAGVEPCTHPIHDEARHERAAGDRISTFTNEQRSRMRRAIAIADYLASGGVDWFSAAGRIPSPRIIAGRGDR